MNMGDILTAVIAGTLAVCFVLSVRRFIRNTMSGKCEGCKGSCHCGHDEKKTTSMSPTHPPVK